MKANRKFIHRDEAVSPVIAVILMVAITVVLAATVYVWVSGFGQSGSQAKTISFSATSSGGIVTLTVVSVSPNFNWNSAKIGITGISTGTYGTLVKGTSFSSFETSSHQSSWTGSGRLSNGTYAIAPGDIIKIGVSSTPTATVAMNLVDVSANTVVASVNLPSLTAISAVTTGFSSCTGTTATLAGAYYSKTGAASSDTAAIQSGDVTRTGGGATTFTHSVGATTATIAAVTGANSYAAGSGTVFTQSGATVGTTATTCT